MKQELELVIKETERSITELTKMREVFIAYPSIFEVALTLGGITTSDQAIYLHPKGSAREYLSLFEGCTFTRHSNDGATYRWETEFCGIQIRILCSEVVANQNGTVVMP